MSTIITTLSDGAAQPVEQAYLRALRAALSRQIEADLERVDRCMAILDAITPDSDLEVDHHVYRPGIGLIGMVGVSSDDEASLCGVGAHVSDNGLYSYGDRELDEADVEMTASERTGRARHRSRDEEAA